MKVMYKDYDHTPEPVFTVVACGLSSVPPSTMGSNLFCLHPISQNSLHNDGNPPFQ